MFTTFTEVDKNFALESYGESSKCFDHTNQMWEQRSCRQVCNLFLPNQYFVNCVKQIIISGEAMATLGIWLL